MHLSMNNINSTSDKRFPCLTPVPTVNQLISIENTRITYDVKSKSPANEPPANDRLDSNAGPSLTIAHFSFVSFFYSLCQSSYNLFLHIEISPLAIMKSCILVSTRRPDSAS